jgi:hypothetical protein
VVPGPQDDVRQGHLLNRPHALHCCSLRLRACWCSEQHCCLTCSSSALTSTSCSLALPNRCSRPPLQV